VGLLFRYYAGMGRAKTMPAEPAAGVAKNLSEPKRSDARRNRRRILLAAFEVFSELGVDAQMTDVAEAAGLGVGTVYRNFASKEALVNALLLDRLEGATVVARRAAEGENAFQALVDLIVLITERQMENRVLSQFLGGRVAGSSELQEQRDIVYEVLDEIVARAKEAGDIRDDVGISDIRMITTSVANLSVADSPLARHLVLRYIGIVMDGLRAPARSKLPTPAVSLADSEAIFQYGPGPSGTALSRGRRTWRT
jgi:AcrR family transcriptional regulator